MPAHRGGNAQTKVAEWRRRRDLSQSALARAVGLPRTTYWRWETGKVRDPKLRALMNLAIALECPNGVDDLIEDRWRERHPFDRTNAPVPPDPEKLWRSDG